MLFCIRSASWACADNVLTMYPRLFSHTSTAVVTKQQWEYTGTNSEGNRFINDNQL